MAKFRGYRHMLSWNPANDFFVKHDHLKDEKVIANLKLLEMEDLSFDLLINVH